MKTYTLSKDEINLITEAINNLELSLENTLDCCSSMVSKDKKQIRNKIQELGLLSLYLEKKGEE